MDKEIVTNVETGNITKIDFSPFDYEWIKRAIVHSINIAMGINYWNSIIARWKILYPDDFEKRKLAVLSFNDYKI